MQLRSWLAGLALAICCGGAASAQEATPPARASVGFWNQADIFWTEGEDLAPCSRADVRRNPLSLATPRFRAASRERHAELLGEIVGPAPLVQQVVASARTCVAAPGVRDTVPVLIADGAGGFSRFHTAFSACMAREGAAQYMGSMTLWIDNHCNW